MRNRMLALNVCEEWAEGRDRCWGNCGRRRPRWQGRNTDLFYNQICHHFLRRKCRRGPSCRHTHVERHCFVADLANLVGEEDAAWDWTMDGPAPQAPQDELTRLLRASPVVNAETVIDGTLQLVCGDRDLERYFLEVHGRVR